MISDTTTPSFSTLLTVSDTLALLERLNTLANQKTKKSITSMRHNKLPIELQALEIESSNLKESSLNRSEQIATDWLIQLFNTLFAKQQIQLVRGKHEPEYFPAYNGQPARIEFAHGFFASALHEISHWCIAGDSRRQLTDFGYWYAPDGRTAAQQQAFERVEVKPQALECLFTLACQRSFQVSQDNLFANFDTSASTFANDVYQQTLYYIAAPQTLPSDARILLHALLTLGVTE
jgi:elongation factor P hydroxylase